MDDYDFFAGLVVVAMIVVFICFVESRTTEKRDIPRKNPQKIEQLPSKSANYVEFDGHQYIQYHVANGGSLCHSPKCPCQLKNESGE